MNCGVMLDRRPKQDGHRISSQLKKTEPKYPDTSAAILCYIQQRDKHDRKQHKPWFEADGGV